MWWASRIPLEANRIINRDSDLLLSPEVSFASLDGEVSKQELDFFEVAAGFPPKLSEGPSKIVGAEVLDPDLARCLLDDVPQGLVA